MISIKTKSDFSVRLANGSDTLSIINIWRECFTNDIIYLDNFINNCFPNSKTWIAIHNNSDKAVAILSLLPSYTIYNGQKYSGGYIYGVATLPEFRGNSLSSYLMDTAFEYSDKYNLKYLVVKPATDDLFDLYMRQSFDILINKDVFSVNLCSNDHENIYNSGFIVKQTRDIFKNPDDFADIVEQLFLIREKEKSNSYLLWPKEILKYALLDVKNKGGNLQIISNSSLNSELYYIEHPQEDNSEIIKVIDCNYKDRRDLYTIISYIKTFHKDVKQIVFEGNFNNLSPHPFPIIKTRSALIKFFDKKLSLLNIRNIHLSLPME